MDGGSLTTAKTVSGGDKAETMKAIGALVTMSYKIAGLSFGTTAEESKRNLKETVSLLYTQLLRYYPNATAQVLETAFTNGANGFYGENHGMPVSRFIDYVRRYYESLQGVNVQQPEEEPLALPGSERADTINLLQTLYVNWQNGGPMAYPAGATLRFIWDEGKFLTAREPETLERYQTKAMESMKTEKLRRAATHPSEFKTIRHEIEGLTIDSMDVKRMACKLIVIDFFRECKEMDIADMHDIFDVVSG